MPVDPRLQVMLDQAAARAAAAGLTAGPGPLPPEVLRAGYRAAILAALGAVYAPVPLAEVRDLPDPADRAAPDVSPLLAADLSGLPPAVVATAEYDPLSSEGARYAERLRAAGVPVTYLDGKGLVHDFLYYPRVARACATAREAFTDAIRSAVAQGAPGAQKGIQHVG